MRVRVLFFGRLRDIVGQPEESIELPEPCRIEDLFSRCRERHPELAPYRSSVVASRNREFAPWSASLAAGDEIAFLPPVSGG